MSFRPGSRIFSAFRTNFRQYYARRNASTAPPGAEPSGFARFWASPVGPKTVHFWYVYVCVYLIPYRSLSQCHQHTQYATNPPPTGRQ